MTVDYLLIGHISQDQTTQGLMLGGTVSYSSLTARAINQQAAVLTSFPESMKNLVEPLAGVPLVRVPTETPTSFALRYTEHGRTLKLLSRASTLQYDHLPEDWKAPSIVHLAPIADEIALSLVQRFPASLIGVTPQGWMRRWDRDGNVSQTRWTNASKILPHVQAVVLSIEDVQGDESQVHEYASQVRFLALTRGRGDVTVFVDGKPYEFPVSPVEVQEETGAGDIFATAFFIRLKATGDPFAAARFAIMLASSSVARVGIDSIPDQETIQMALESL